MEQITLYTLVVLTFSNPSVPEVVALQNTQLYDVNQRIVGLTYEQCSKKSGELYEAMIASGKQFLIVCEQDAATK